MATVHSMRADLTAEFVRSALDYDPQTGVFRWRRRRDMTPQWNGRYAGKIAGCIMHSKHARTGYRKIALLNEEYLAHRLAWLHSKGEWPQGRLDHRDGDGLNNAIGNLRLATPQQNAINQRPTKKTRTGITGVWWCERLGKFLAHITVDQKMRRLGWFSSAEEARTVRLRAEKTLFGEFSNG